MCVPLGGCRILLLELFPPGNFSRRTSAPGHCYLLFWQYTGHSPLRLHLRVRLRHVLVLCGFGTRRCLLLEQLNDMVCYWNCHHLLRQKEHAIQNTQITKHNVKTTKTKQNSLANIVKNKFTGGNFRSPAGRRNEWVRVIRPSIVNHDSWPHPAQSVSITVTGQRPSRSNAAATESNRRAVVEFISLRWPWSAVSCSNERPKDALSGDGHWCGDDDVASV